MNFITALEIQSNGENIKCSGGGPAKSNGKFVGWIELWRNGNLHKTMLSTEPIFKTAKGAERHMKGIVCQVRRVVHYEKTQTEYSKINHGGEMKMKVNLKDFCARKALSRFDLSAPSAPWSAGEYSYATDGNIIIRVPRIKDIPEKEKVPDAEKIFNRPVKPVVFYKLPEVPPEMTDCEFCFGKGTAYGHVCEECEGEGKYPVPADVEIGGVFFADIYVDKINKLPNPTIGPTGKKRPAWFKFDGGDGLLMPLSEPYPKH